MKKALSIILAAVLVCTFAIPVFAGEGFIFNNSLFCLTVPELFTGDDYEYDETAFFYNSERDTWLDIVVCENTLNTVAATDEGDKINSDILYYIKEYAYSSLPELTTISKTKINGLTAISGESEYEYSDGEIEPFTEYNCIFMFTTEENVILLWFGKSYQEFSVEETAEIAKCVGSFIMNGTYTGGDSLTVEHDFSSAEPFDLDKFYYGDYEDDDDFITDVGDGAIVMGIFRVVCIIFSLPTVALIIAAIVLGVKYSKKKKQLKEYKRLYGEIPPNVNYYGNQGGFNPQYNQPYNQQQNFYGAPQGFNQQYGSAPAGQPQFNQPVQPVQQEPTKQNYVSIFSAEEQNENKDENNTEN